MSSRAANAAGAAAARHLKRGLRMPEIPLPATSGDAVSFARLAGRSIVYCYPWTGRPGVPDPPNWDSIPGAHGSTPQTEGFRDLYAGFREIGAEVFGLSTQPTDHQREMVRRLQVPFAIVSDEKLAFQQALSLPTFVAGDAIYLQRLTLAIKDGRIERVYYPVPFPAAHAREVCAWLGMIDRAF